MNYAVGIDIGGTNTRVALIDETYQLIERTEFKTNIENPYETLDKIKEALSEFNHEVIGAGISCPGPLDLFNGKVLNPPNLQGKWINFPLVQEFERVVGIPGTLENDANLAALAEATIGQGKNLRYVQFITVSTGIGSGFVIDKEIYRGSHGFANEIANMIVWRDGPSHGKIIPGGIEAISSGTAIVKRAHSLGLQAEHAGEVNDLARQGNEKAMVIMEDAIEYLANTIAIMIALVDPEIFILGGSVSLKIENFVEEIEKRVKSKVYDTMKEKVCVVKSNLNEDSGLFGAACLVFNDIEDQRTLNIL